jgi:hypothetical protein
MRLVLHRKICPMHYSFAVCARYFHKSGFLNFQRLRWEWNQDRSRGGDDGVDINTVNLINNYSGRVDDLANADDSAFHVL